MLYLILFFLLLGLTLTTIGLYLVRRDWNDPELRELSIIGIYIAIAFIEAGTVLLFFFVINPPPITDLPTKPFLSVGSMGSIP